MGVAVGTSSDLGSSGEYKNLVKTPRPADTQSPCRAQSATITLCIRRCIFTGSGHHPRGWAWLVLLMPTAESHMRTCPLPICARAPFPPVPSVGSHGLSCCNHQPPNQPPLPLGLPPRRGNQHHPPSLGHPSRVGGRWAASGLSPSLMISQRSCRSRPRRPSWGGFLGAAFLRAVPLRA